MTRQSLTHISRPRKSKSELVLPSTLVLIKNEPELVQVECRQTLVNISVWYGMPFAQVEAYSLR